MEFEFSAGGVIVEDGQVLLVRMTGHGGAWTFPKGRIEKGERKDEAALREVEEETGYRCRILQPLPSTQYWYRSQGKLIKKVVYWFLMEPVEQTRQPDWEIEEEAWFPLQEAVEKLAYSSDKELLKGLLASMAQE